MSDFKSAPSNLLRMSFYLIQWILVQSPLFLKVQSPLYRKVWVRVRVRYIKYAFAPFQIDSLSYHIISYHIICIFSSYNLHILQKYTNILHKYFCNFKIRFILVFETRKKSQKATVALSSSPFSSTGFCELTGEIY